MGTAIKLFFSNVWEFLLPIIKIFLSQAGPILAKLAMDAVKITAESMVGATSTEKRDSAYSLILTNLQSQGIKLGASTINMAIELAYQKFKEGK